MGVAWWRVLAMSPRTSLTYSVTLDAVNRTEHEQTGAPCAPRRPRDTTQTTHHTLCDTHSHATRAHTIIIIHTSRHTQTINISPRRTPRPASQKARGCRVARLSHSLRSLCPRLQCTCAASCGRALAALELSRHPPYKLLRTRVERAHASCASSSQLPPRAGRRLPVCSTHRRTHMHSCRMDHGPQSYQQAAARALSLGGDSSNIGGDAPRRSSSPNGIAAEV